MFKTVLKDFLLHVLANIIQHKPRLKTGLTF